MKTEEIIDLLQHYQNGGGVEVKLSDYWIGECGWHRLESIHNHQWNFQDLIYRKARTVVWINFYSNGENRIFETEKMAVDASKLQIPLFGPPLRVAIKFVEVA